MYHYHNYAYSSGVHGCQNVAGYSTRQSAAAAAASHNPFMSTSLVADNAGARRLDEAAERDLTTSVLTSPSCRRPTPGGASSYLDRSPADVVPPPPSTWTHKDRLMSPAARSAHLSSPPALVGVQDGVLYSSPLDGVALRVDADVNENDQRQQHARSHSAPAAPRRRSGVSDHRHSGPPNCSSPSTCYLQSMSPNEKRTDAERRMLHSPPPPPSYATPTPRDSTTSVRHRRTFPPSDAELNGPVVDTSETDVASPTTRRPNSASFPLASTSCGSYDPVLTRRRLRATRGRLGLCATGDGGLGSALAGMAIVSGVALVFSVVAVQLLLRLTATSRRSDATNAGDSLVSAATSMSDDRTGTAVTRTVLEEVAIALAAVTVALDLCCLLTLSMQCFFAVKLAHCRSAEHRVFGYLEKCSVTRMAASAGLFLSIPIFLLALMLYAVLEYTFTSAIICVVVFTVGIVCITITAAHSIHCWNVEKSRVNSAGEFPIKSSPLALPHDDSKQTVNSDDSTVTQLKLSTLL